MVFTEPVDAEHEAAYNDWYTTMHIPDVLAVPGYVRATRYRSFDGEREIAQRYLALYELEVTDVSELQAVSDEHMRRIASGEMRRSRPETMSRHSMRALYYMAVGPRVGVGDPVPQSVVLSFTDLEDEAHVDEFDAWYHDVHLPEVIASPGFTAASLYRVSPVNMLGQPWVVPQKYLGVYELDEGTEEGVGEARAELRRRVAAGGPVGGPALAPAKVSQAFHRISDRLEAPRR